MAKLIGTAPNQVPTNGDLGSMAFEDRNNYLTKYVSNQTYRNLIINGDMSVAQRGTTFSGMTVGQYTLDRWSSSTSGANLTMSQQSFTGTDIDNFNSKNYIRFTVNTANNNCGFLQYVEDAKRFLGKTVTLSFKAKGTNPAGGIIETAIACYTGSGGSYTTENRQQYSVTSDWQTFSFTTTIQSASGLTINDADSFMYIYPVIQPNGDTSTTSWEVDIAEVQVEYGNVATSFEVVPYDVNLRRCQRYFQRYGNTNYRGIMVGTVQTGGGGNLHCCMTYMTTMRTQPSSSFSNLIVTNRWSANYTVSSIGATVADVNSLYVKFTSASLSSQSNHECWLITVDNGVDGYFQLDAEF